jgi:hypothetical protein
VPPVDTSDPKELRKFGLVMAAAFLSLGGLRFGWHGAFPWVPASLAGTFLVLGLAAPRVLGPVYAAWMKFALALNWTMTRVLLTAAFYGLITPTAVFHKLFASDPLKRAWEPDAESYWEPPDSQPDDLEQYKNQF